MDMGGYPDCMLYADNEGVYCRFCDFTNPSLFKVRRHVHDEHSFDEWVCVKCRGRSKLSGQETCDRCSNGVMLVTPSADDSYNERINNNKTDDRSNQNRKIIRDNDNIKAVRILKVAKPKVVVPKTAVGIGKQGSGMSSKLKADAEKFYKKGYTIIDTSDLGEVTIPDNRKLISEGLAHIEAKKMQPKGHEPKESHKKSEKCKEVKRMTKAIVDGLMDEIGKIQTILKTYLGLSEEAKDYVKKKMGVK
jgi:RecJ-like exonuclease